MSGPDPDGRPPQGPSFERSLTQQWLVGSDRSYHISIDALQGGGVRLGVVFSDYPEHVLRYSGYILQLEVRPPGRLMYWLGDSFQARLRGANNRLRRAADQYLVDNLVQREAVIEARRFLTEENAPPLPRPFFDPNLGT